MLLRKISDADGGRKPLPFKERLTEKIVERSWIEKRRAAEAKRDDIFFNADSSKALAEQVEKIIFKQINR
jgi:hypothetical protein